MISRNQVTVNPDKGAVTLKSEEVDPVLAAKQTLKKQGYTWRAAAKHLKYSYTHVAHTLTGRRTSKKLLQKIAELPPLNTKPL